MTVISKADLARELGVSKARVSQYVKSGLPVRPDGQLDRDAALNHLRLYRVSETGSDRGPVRATKLLKSGPMAYVKSEAELQPEWIVSRWSGTDKAKINIVKELVRRARPVIARSAIEAGTSIEVAYSCTAILQFELLGLANDLLDEEGVFGWGAGVGNGLTLEDRGPVPSWQDYAAQIGQTFDEDVCEDRLHSLPIQQDQPLLGSDA